MAKEYYNIPFIQLSKENLLLLRENLEMEEIGEIMSALYPFIYEGIEPQFKTKHLTATWNNIISTIDRQAEGFFKQVEAGKYGQKGGRPRKGESMDDYKARKQQDFQPNENFDNMPIGSYGSQGYKAVKQGA